MATFMTMDWLRSIRKEHIAGTIIAMVVLCIIFIVVSAISEIVMDRGIFSRILYTEEEVMASRFDDAMLKHVTFKKFFVGCPTADMTMAERARWTEYAAERKWAPYPEGGADCVDP